MLRPPNCLIVLLGGAIAGCSQDAVVGRYVEAMCTEGDADTGPPCHKFTPAAQVSMVTITIPSTPTPTTMPAMPPSASVPSPATSPPQPATAPAPTGTVP